MNGVIQYKKTALPFLAINLCSLIVVVLVCFTFGGCPSKNAGQSSNRYKALLAKAHRATLQERTDSKEDSLINSFQHHCQPGSDVYHGSYREAAKTSYSTTQPEQSSTIDAIVSSLPNDDAMKEGFPELAPKGSQPNLSPRIDLEKRSIVVEAWIYWVRCEGDNDFHVILGDTPSLTDKTVFMNSEISGLPKDNPSQEPFVQLRTEIRNFLANHSNENGLFDPPVHVAVSGSLLWDGQHTFPNTPGPNDLPPPPTAWEIHPIHSLVEQ